MVGKIFITRQGYDPELGKHVKDPYLGPSPTLGACRPDIRKRLKQGDHIFVISGKIPEANQFVMAGFEIETKIEAIEAYRLFPNLRLRKLKDGQLEGNIVVDANGKRHHLDNHNIDDQNAFDKRIKNYVIGTNLIKLATPEEIAEGRTQTLDALREILHKKGSTPIAVVGRWGSELTANQVLQLRDWLASMKGPQTDHLNG